jgi:stage II sporulation protein D
MLFVAAALAVMLSAPALAGLYIPDAYASPLVQASAAPDTDETASAESSGDSAAEPGTTVAEISSETAAADVLDQESVTVSVYDTISGRTLILGLEEYITGVVAGEMPVSFGPEALKAQAVAARSYALYKIAHGSQNDAAHHGAQLCTDSTHCKAYVTLEELTAKWGGDKAEDIFTQVGAAVKATEGEILTYDGAAALTVFHSSSDGVTESAAAVWGSAVPYLVSVDTPEETDPSVTVFTQDQLAAALSADGVSYDGTALPKLSYDDAGRVASVDFGGVSVAGTRVREALGLRSTDFTLVILEGEYIFTVRGYGHGVGMSQYGAAAMAAQGSDYKAILAHYYPGTALTQMQAQG